MKAKSKISLLTLVFLFVCSVAMLLFSACTLGMPGETAQSKLTLDKTSVQLYVNGTMATVKATLDPIDKSAQYEWSIDNDGVATIAAAQNVCRLTPKAEGTAKLTVTAGGMTATCDVTVGADQHVQLAAPSFTYDQQTGIITIVDDKNDAANVKGYELHFYAADGKDVGAIEIASGDKIDTKRLEKGTYTAKIIAVGSKELYTASEPSSSTATVEVTVDPLYDLSTGDAGALEKENNWAYYKYDWVGVEEAYYYDGAATIVFSNNAADSTSYAWILQLIYNYGKGEEGKTYKMQLKIDSTAEGRITLGDKAVTVHEGENVCNTVFTGNNLFKIKFGVDGELNTLKEGTVKVYILGIEELTSVEKLAVPSFTYDASTKTVKITDEINSEYDVNYTLGFFDSVAATAPKGVTIVKDGGEVDFSSVPSGKYYVRIMAATNSAALYASSDWSDALATIDVVNQRVDIKNGGQAVSANNADTWYEWHSTSNQKMPNTTIEEAYMDDADSIHLTFACADETYYQPLKLHYNASSINVGDEYTLSFTIVSEKAGKITVNGEIVELQAGENQVSVTRQQPDKSNGGGMRTTITIQFGIQASHVNENGDTISDNAALTGSFVISNVQITPVTE